MKTKRLISSIGYNSEGFLSATLDRLQNAGVIDWAHYIRHDPEEDEVKPHWHIVVMPSKSVDTRALQREFDELDITTPGKPLGVLPWRFSHNLDYWLLYAIHDPAFLASKGQVRKFHYPRSAVRSTCPELLLEQWQEVNLAKYGLGQELGRMAEQKVPWEQVVCSGLVPPAQWTFWREVYFGLLRGAGMPVRASLTHTPKRPALPTDADLAAAVAEFERSASDDFYGEEEFHLEGFEP